MLIRQHTVTLFQFMLFCFPSCFQSEDHTPSPNHPSRSGSTPSHTHHISSTSSEDQYGTTELFKPDNAPKGGPEQLGADGGGGVQGESGNTAVQKQITDSQLKEVSEPKPPSSGSDHQKLKVKVCVQIVCIIKLRGSMLVEVWSDSDV